MLSLKSQYCGMLSNVKDGRGFFVYLKNYTKSEYRVSNTKWTSEMPKIPWNGGGVLVTCIYITWPPVDREPAINIDMVNNKHNKLLVAHKIYQFSRVCAASYRYFV